MESMDKRSLAHFCDISPEIKEICDQLGLFTNMTIHLKNVRGEVKTVTVPFRTSVWGLMKYYNMITGVTVQFIRLVNPRSRSDISWSLNSKLEDKEVEDGITLHLLLRMGGDPDWNNPPQSVIDEANAIAQLNPDIPVQQHGRGRQGRGLFF